MDVNRIVSELDTEIARLQHIRAALLDTDASASAKSNRNGSKSHKGVVAKSAAPKAAKSKRVLSPEGRKRIADAMKRRWAERRKQTAK